MSASSYIGLMPHVTVERFSSWSLVSISIICRLCTLLLCIDENGEVIDKTSFLAHFLERLRAYWDIVDEGTMEDLLAVQARYNADGSVTLHQTKYIEKLMVRFLPGGGDNNVQRNSLPYSDDLVDKVLRALDRPADPPPSAALLREYQQRIGALMYLATSTRVDIAYVTHILARAASRSTEELLDETTRVFQYLRVHRSVGLTYHPKPGTGARLSMWVVCRVLGSASVNNLRLGYHLAGGSPQLGLFQTALCGVIIL